MSEKFNYDKGDVDILINHNPLFFEQLRNVVLTRKLNETKAVLNELLQKNDKKP